MSPLVYLPQDEHNTPVIDGKLLEVMQELDRNTDKAYENDATVIPVLRYELLESLIVLINKLYPSDPKYIVSLEYP